MEKSKNNTSNRDETTQKIAIVLLYTFIISIGILLLGSFFIFYFPTNDANDCEFRKGWFELLKNALILLGSILTTIIGYYFGQREGANKAEKAEIDANKKIEDVEKKAEEIIEKKDESLKEEIPTNNIDEANDIDQEDDTNTQEIKKII